MVLSSLSLLEEKSAARIANPGLGFYTKTREETK
jgi:hypothetical protein